MSKRGLKHSVNEYIEDSMEATLSRKLIQPGARAHDEEIGELRRILDRIRETNKGVRTSDIVSAASKIEEEIDREFENCKIAIIGKIKSYLPSVITTTAPTSSKVIINAIEDDYAPNMEFLMNLIK